MKTIMALGFAAAVMVSVTAQAQSLGQEFCSDLAEFATVVARDRDKGMNQDSIKLHVYEVFSGTELDWMVGPMISVIESTYMRPHYEPHMEGNDVYNICMDE